MTATHDRSSLIAEISGLGDVTHDAIERVLKALDEMGCIIADKPTAHPVPSGAPADMAEALTTIDRLRRQLAETTEHSTILNSISWKMAAALGDVPDGADWVVSDVEGVTERLIAEVKRLRLAQTTLTVGLRGEWAPGRLTCDISADLRDLAARGGMRTASLTEAADQFDELAGLLTQAERERDQLKAQRDQVLALHTEFDGRCTHCLEWCYCAVDAVRGDCTHGNADWPCKTAAICAPADPKPGPFHNAPYDRAADAAGQPCGCRIADEDEHPASEHTYCNPGGDPPCGGCHSCLSAMKEYYERSEAVSGDAD